MNQCLIEIYSGTVDNNVNGRIARKCALLCYFLNTRLESNVKFVHGGVFGRRLNDNYQPERGQTNYEVLINRSQVLYNANYFDDENYSEADFRTISKLFIDTVAGLSNDYQSFNNFRFLNFAPIVVGNWSVRDQYIDGRYIQVSPLGFRISYPSEYKMLVRPLVPFVIPSSKVVIDAGFRGGNVNFGNTFTGTVTRGVEYNVGGNVFTGNLNRFDVNNDKRTTTEVRNVTVINGEAVSESKVLNNESVEKRNLNPRMSSFI